MKLHRTLSLVLLVLLGAAVYAGEASAQCCCGGVHLSVIGEDKKPITPVVTALISVDGHAEPIAARLIETKTSESGDETIRVSADCYGFKLMEITVAHQGGQMVLRLRDLPFGELGEIHFDPVTFRPSTSEIDFKGKAKGHCKETSDQFGCVIAAERWQKVSDKAETALKPPPPKTQPTN
ncbi:MAG TPA: hypothetical protein VJV03_08940 [Pyrinomonadaceae bacterium]|nr:hypothetical protein [Pyrinomonadaceae bacterium]